MDKTSNLKERIKSVQLSKTEARIAEHFLELDTALSFKTAKDIAFELDVSDTSVIRTCRKLGYGGYSELQNQQQALISAYIDDGKYIIPRDQVESKFQEYRGSDLSICREFALENLSSVLRRNEPDSFRAAADIIYKSNHIYIAGFRGMAGMAESLGVLLHQYIPFVDFYDRVDTGCVEKAIDLGKDDCMILLSVERYSKMTRTLAEIAIERGCRRIAIVDKLSAPAAYKADLVILSEFAGPTAMNSFIATQFIVELIIFEISRLRGTAQQARLSYLDQSLDKLELY